MSKVLIQKAVQKDFFPVSDAAVATGWLPGQVATLGATGQYINLITAGATGGPSNVAMFVLGDDDTEVVTPPSGSLATVYYGAGTKLVIDHSTEVKLGSATRAYNASLESASAGMPVYLDTAGKFSATSSGSVMGMLFQVPAAVNNYGAGIITRF